MIDTHAHVDPSSAGEVLARAREAGVERVITVATSIAGAHDALALAGDDPGVFAALGIHPHNAGGADATRIDELGDLLRSTRAVAVGETGLDYFRDYAPRDAQLRLFEMLVGPLLWTILRAVIGFGCSGLFIATESWLNAKAEPTERGRIFSVYMFGTFLALALGQLLIGQAKVETSGPFNAIAVLFAVALVIVSTTRAEPPRRTASSSLPLGQLPRAAPVAVAGCMVSGLVSASFYSLVPAWLQDEGIAHETIATFMLFAVLGGLAFQVPIGRLSDQFDRRIVLSILSVGFAATAIALVNLPHSRAVILPTAALLGGFMSTLYPVCVANAHDQMPADQVVAVSGQLILVSGLGSILGPLIGTSVMARFDIDGLFYFMAAVGLLLALLAVARRLVTAPPAHQERTFEILAPQATPLAHDLLGSPMPAQSVSAHGT